MLSLQILIFSQQTIVTPLIHKFYNIVISSYPSA